MAVIDAHQHFWDLARAHCQWPTADLAAIHRSFGPEDLAPLLAAHDVTGTVLIQSQPSEPDTKYLLELAEECAFVRAVVGWVALREAGAPERIRQLSHHPKLRGLRPMLQDIADERWLLSPELEPAVKAMQAQCLSLDALVLVRHLPHLSRFARRYPALPIVIDHGAKPAVATDSIDAWRSALEPLAELPQVHCKLSGLLTEAPSLVSDATLLPYVRTLIELFGAERLMWGSDWPVVNLNGSFESWLSTAKRLVEQVLVEQGATSREVTASIHAIFGENAQRFYRITTD